MLIVNKYKKSLTVLCIALMSLFSFANCFGSFGITKTVYSTHSGLRIGSGLLAKVIQTILMYFPFSVLYAFGFVADIILFNLVEFWSGSNPVAKAEFDFNGKLVREFKNGNESVVVTYSDFGKRMDIAVKIQDKTENFVALQDKEGILYKEVNGKLQEVTVKTTEVGSKTILKMVQDGKITSAKVVSTDDLKTLEQQL